LAGVSRDLELNVFWDGGFKAAFNCTLTKSRAEKCGRAETESIEELREIISESYKIQEFLSNEKNWKHLVIEGTRGSDRVNIYSLGPEGNYEGAAGELERYFCKHINRMNFISVF